MSKQKKSLLLAPGEDLVEYEQSIESVKYKMQRNGSTREEAEREINKAKQSFSSTRTASSLNTIFALTNSMVGSVCLVIPIVINIYYLIYFVILKRSLLGQFNFKLRKVIVPIQKQVLYLKT